MLIKYENEKFIIRNFFCKDKTIIFLLVKDNNIPTRKLGKMITLYLSKVGIINDRNDLSNLQIFLYFNKIFHNSFIDKGVIKKILFSYDGCIHINKVQEADIWVTKYFANNIYDFSFNSTVRFDNRDYYIYRRTVKRTKRLQMLRAVSKEKKLLKFQSFFTFFTLKNNYLNINLQS